MYRRQVFFSEVSDITSGEISDAIVSRGFALGRRRAVRIILATALVTRLLVLYDVISNYPHEWLYSRGIEMGLLAKSLLLGLGYSSPFGGLTGPTAFIAPGYPTLIAAIFLVFGTYSFASAIAIIVMQIFVSMLTIWLIMWIADEVAGDRAAIIAGSFWAMSLPLLWIPTIFWETSISSCAVVGMIALALRCQRQPTMRSLILMGAACGSAALINPALLPTLLAILGWTASQTWTTARRAVGLGLLVVLLIYSPWPVRNAYRFRAFIPLRSTVGFELWMGNRPGATGYLDESLFPMYNKQELASYVAKGELAYTRDKSDEAKKYIVAHPGKFIAMSLRRFWRFWSGTGSSPGSPFYAIHAGLTSALGFAGLVLLYRRRRRTLAWLMGLPLLLFPLPYYITHAEFRYRLVIDPLLTILSAYAVTQFAAIVHVDAED